MAKQGMTRRALWVAVARGLELSLREDKKNVLTGSLSARLTGERLGLSVEISAKQTSVRSSHGADIIYYRMYFDIRVAYKFGTGPRFELLREGTFRSWLKKFGYQDIQVGDTSLDFALTIKGEPEDEIRDLILPNAALLSRYLRGAKRPLPTTDGLALECSIETGSSDAEGVIEEITDVLDLLVAIAATDIVGMRHLVALPEAEEGRGIDGKVVVRVEAPTPVDFYPSRDAQGTRLRAHASADGYEETGPLPCSDREAFEKSFGQRGLPLDLLGDAEIRVDVHGVWIDWARAVEDEATLMAAARLLTLLASPSGEGAYR